MVRSNHLMRYRERPPTLYDFTIHFDLTFLAAGTSYYVGGVWARDEANPQHKYLIDLVRKRGDFVEQMAEIRRMVATYPQATKVVIEDMANGSAAIATLRRELKSPPVIAVRPSKSKEARMSAVLPEFQAGNVWIPEQAPWVAEYEHELTTFPNSSNDDQVDMTTQALLDYQKDPFVLI
jgi:phage uncharacterized protein (putative large terminase), C-terminal domain